MDERAQKADEILILRCQFGDEWAFCRLISEYDGKVRYYIRRLVAREADADDVTQQVWFAVWKQLPKLREPKTFRTWLYRIARNKALQTFRKRRDEIPLEEAVAVAETEEEFGPEEAAEVHTALGMLNQPQRDALALRFLEEMSYEEIAEVTGCSVGTVRSRIHYGKKALRQIMEDLRNDSR